MTQQAFPGDLDSANGVTVRLRVDVHRKWIARRFWQHWGGGALGLHLRGGIIGSLIMALFWRGCFARRAERSLFIVYRASRFR
jgi:hypothetical protein